jgi:hypothetical protein
MKRIPKGHFTVFNQAGAHYEVKNVTWIETISMFYMFEMLSLWCVDSYLGTQ